MNEDDQEIDNRDKKKYEMVVLAHKKNRQSGAFQTIDQIFTRLPLPRLEKNGYKFLFENLKENVESILRQEDHLQKIREEEQRAIDAIGVKLGKPPDIPDGDLMKQTLASGGPLFKSLVYLRKQQEFGFSKFEGDVHPFLQDSAYIKLDKISRQIPNTRLFLEDQPPLKRQTVEFVNQNELIFKDKSFPSNYDINKRAQVLAKLYLLEIYRQETRKFMMLDRQDQVQLQKKREINKIKQDMEKEKLKEGELIEDMDLMKQVIRILQLIEKKMNALAYEQFKNRNGDKATQIKRSLQKLKNTVMSEPLPKTKLKILIGYKHKKGW